MALTVVLGGAAAGKSRFAIETAERNGDVPLVYVATAEPDDAEMTTKIDRHRAQRGDAWDTVEEPVDVAPVLDAIPENAAVVIDCLTLWIANLMGSGSNDDDIIDAARALVRRLVSRSGATIVVSNEVGLGVVPAMPVGRRYRELLGRVNAEFVAASDEAVFLVAGRVLPLAPS